MTAIENPLMLSVLGAMHTLGPATINALSEKTGESRDKVGVVCRRLAAAKYAKRKVGSHFRDERIWSLTEDGEALRTRLLEALGFASNGTSDGPSRKREAVGAGSADSARQR